jgi:hypothetical protein
MKTTLVSLFTLVAINIHASLSIGSKGTVVLYQNTSQYSGQNGEGAFMMYSPQINGGAGTLTLCVQPDVGFMPGSGNQYSFIVNSGSVGSTVGVDTKDPFTGAPMNSLTIGTAYLFSQFSAGTLAGFDYTYGRGFTQSATDLEDAINSLQGYGPATGGGVYFVDLAEQKLDLNAAGVMKNANGAYDVGVLNLYYPDGDVAQNQLVMMTPVSEASTWIWGCLTLAVVGGGIAKNRMKNGQDL